jgi:hypothetical protein
MKTSWGPRLFSLCSDLATRLVTDDSRRYTVLYSLKSPSLLVKCYRDSFPRVKKRGVKLTTRLHLVLILRILRAVPLLQAHFHGVQSDFTFSYSFHVDIYFAVQPEPTRSETQAEKQFHHCYRFSPTLRFAIVPPQSTDS